MSTEDTNPTPTPPAPERETVEVTVSVPAHRVEQFHRFHQRFLEMAGHWDDQVGREDMRGPWGRHGRHGHGPHRRCRSRRHDEAAA